MKSTFVMLQDVCRASVIRVRCAFGWFVLTAAKCLLLAAEQSPLQRLFPDPGRISRPQHRFEVGRVENPPHELLHPSNPKIEIKPRDPRARGLNRQMVIPHTLDMTVTVVKLLGEYKDLCRIVDT